LSVYDASNNKLGALIGLYNDMYSYYNGVVVYQNGLFVNLLFSGHFPVPNIWWNGASCHGTGYLSDVNGSGGIVIGANQVIYSHQNNALYVPNGSGSVSSALLSGVQTVEEYGASSSSFANADGSSNCQAASSVSGGPYGGWELSTAVNGGASVDSTLGWTLSGNPLGVAGPIKIQ
jgi:hypothetical protein